MKKIFSLLISFSLLTTLAACNGTSKGPSADTKCVGGQATASDTSGTTNSAISQYTGSNTTSGADTSSSSSGGDTAAKIDAALRNCKIITTIVNKVKAEVIGTGGFGSPNITAGGSISGSNFAAGGMFNIPTSSLTGGGAGGDDSNSCAADTSSSSDTGLTGFGAQGIFTAFSQSGEFQAAIGAAFTLYVVIYGVALASGMARASISEAIIRVAKISIIAALATSWSFFYSIIGSFFVEGTDEIIGYFLQVFQESYAQNTIANGNGAGLANELIQNPGLASGNIFTFLDAFIARIFSYQTFAFVAALFNAGPYAPVYAAILIMSLFWVLQGVIKVVSVYIISLFAKALLIAVAPIFLMFLLFKRTENLFEAWVKQMASFSLQPILIMAFVGLFAQLLQPFFDEFATFKMCWLQIKGADDKYGWKFVQANSATNVATDPGVNSAPPISLQAVLLFGFFAWLFINSLKMVDSIVGTITNSGANLAQIVALKNIIGKEGEATGLSKATGIKSPLK